MGKQASTADIAAIGNHMGRYCWLVDEGEAEAWANLWTEDGVFTGISPEPVVGREQLKHIPITAFKDHGGKLRHMIGQIYVEYGSNENEAIAKFYNLVTEWQNGGKFFVMALCTVLLVRAGDGWKIKRNDAILLS